MILFLIAISLVLGVGYFTLLQHYGKMWDAIENESSSSEKAVSIVIPFRNEREVLQSLVHSLNNLDTQGLEVEVLFVNDASTDGGASIIAEAALRIPFKLINADGSGKKAALKTGWKQCKHSIVLQTDADCTMDSQWVKKMLSGFREGVNLVSGPVCFAPPKTFWDKLVNLDFIGLIAIGAAHIQWDKPMICNGANLAYRASELQSAELLDSKASGDDVFLMQSVNSRNNSSVVFMKDHNAMITSRGPKSFNEFWHQRLRWASKNNSYADKLNATILKAIWFYNALIVFCFCMIEPVYLTVGAFLVIVKLIAEDGFYARFTDFFKTDTWFALLFCGQPFHILYMTILPVFSQIVSYRWKDRKVK